MNLKSIAIASAVGGLLALGSTGVLAADAPKDKCAGIAEARRLRHRRTFLRRPKQAGQGPDRLEVRAEGRVREDGRQAPRSREEEGDVTTHDAPHSGWHQNALPARRRSCRRWAHRSPHPRTIFTKAAPRCARCCARELTTRSAWRRGAGAGLGGRRRPRAPGPRAACHRALRARAGATGTRLLGARRRRVLQRPAAAACPRRPRAC